MWNYFNNSSSDIPLNNPVPAAVRQMAHEILKTLKSPYPEKRLLHTHDSAIFGDIHLGGDFPAGNLVGPISNRGGVQTKELVEKVGRNDQCPCSSGKKYKKCHGK